MPQQFSITVLSGVSTGDVFRFSLEPNGAVVIGRAQDVDLVLQDPTVSRRHAKIELLDKGFFLSDLGSTHGTVHMGFPVQSGEANRRQLHDNDEFKVGDAIFRAGFDEDAFVEKKVEKEAVRAGSGPRRKVGRKTLIKAGLGVVLFLVLLALLFPQNKGGLPAQKSNEVLLIPQKRVLGYAVLGSGAELSDRSHMDKVQFALPVSDVLIEYEYLAETEIDVLIDESHIEKLPANTAGWQKRALICRDLLSGSERKLVFDNLDFPKKTPGKAKIWAIRNIRSTSLSRGISPTFDGLLNNALALVDRVGKTPDALFNLLRAAQIATVGALAEGNLDAVGMPIQLDAPALAEQEIAEKLDSMIRERREQVPTPEMLTRHRDALTFISGNIDAELWRRYNIMTRQAQNLAKMKQFIEAHDTLMSLRSMFPTEDDVRYEDADSMLHDKKIVPPRVLKNPGKYRK